MKTLKITLLLAAVLLLTVSGQSSDTITNDVPQDPTTMDVHLVAHKKQSLKFLRNKDNKQLHLEYIPLIELIKGFGVLS